jgi:hypothetical protein
MEKELPRLNKKYRGNETALAVFKAFEGEIDFFRKFSRFYGYAFFVMQKIIPETPPSGTSLGDREKKT